MSYHLETESGMVYPIKVCSVCSEEFELKTGKPGFANRCPECSEPDATAPANQRKMDAEERKRLAENIRTASTNLNAVLGQLDKGQ